MPISDWHIGRPVQGIVLMASVGWLSSLWRAPHLLGRWSLLRKQTEKAKVSKPISSMLPWLPFQFLALGSTILVTDYDVKMKSK